MNKLVLWILICISISHVQILAQEKIETEKIEIGDFFYTIDIENHSAALVGISKVLYDPILPDVVTVKGIEYPVLTIGNGMKYQMSGSSLVGSVKLPRYCKKITDYALEESYYNHSITEIVFPERLEEIGTDAFNSALKVSKIDLPATFKYFGYAPFWDCRIDTVICRNPVPPTHRSGYVGGVAREYFGRAEILLVPKKSIELYKQADYWKQFKIISAYDDIIIEGIELNYNELDLCVGETVQMLRNITPEDADINDIRWESSADDIVSVSSDGIIRAVSVGIATITAICGEVTASCKVTVNPVAASGITLNVQDLSLLVGQSDRLIATVLPENATDKTIIWSSGNEAVAFVAEDGTVRAVSVGVTTITATCGDVHASCMVTVNPISPTNIDIVPANITLTVGNSMKLEAILLPENITSSDVEWSSSDAHIATVTSDGTVTAINVGNAVVTATTSNSLSAECLVEVIETPATDVVIDKEALGIVGDDLAMKVGDVKNIKVTVLPETTTDKKVTFESSDPSVASVDSDGKITALSLGKTTITVTAKSGVSSSINVTVVSTPAESVTLDRKKISLQVSGTVLLVATVMPENTSDKSVIWESSDTSIAAVVETGLVTAVGIGNAIITASTTNGLSDECEVTVIETPATDIVIDKEALGINGDGLEMKVGDVKNIKVTVLPETTTEKKVTFESSDPSVASVDSDGKITALSLGKTTITVTAKSGVSSSLNVYVVSTAAESVTLNRRDVTLQITERFQLEATVMPENTTDKSVYWESSDTSVATVDGTGLVTAVGVGSTIITASTTNGHSDECMITVVGIPVSEIIIDKESLGIEGDDPEMNVGETRTINVTVVPDNATDKGIYFKSSDPSIASVNSYGKLTALSPGKSVITVSAYSGASTSFNVIVKMQTVSSVGTKVSPLKIREGGVISVSAEQPTGGYESGWKWQWDLNGAQLSSDLEFDYIPTMPWGTERSTESIQFVFRAYNHTPSGHLYTSLKETTETVTVYRPPLMPKQLLKKGDGTSHTLIAMADIDNDRLTELGYTFVYGYTDVAGNDHIIASTPLRYCRAEEYVYDNPENSFWVYCAWTYDDGSVVTSGKRYMNGLADEDFDASSFNNNVKLTVKRNNPEGWITPTPDGVSLDIVSDTDSYIMIYDVMGRLVKSLKAEGGTAFSDKIVLDGNMSKVYIVKITSGMESIERKIIVR